MKKDNDGFYYGKPLSLGLEYHGENIRDLYADRNRYRKEARKKQDTLNRINKLIPGSERCWHLETIGVYLDADATAIEEAREADPTAYPGADPEAMRRDALFLRRMEHDLITMREALGRFVRGSANRKYDPAQWARGERP